MTKLVCKFCASDLNNSFTCTICPGNLRYILINGEIDTIVMDDDSHRYTIMIDVYRKETRIYDNYSDFFNAQVVLDHIANITPYNLNKKLRSILTFM